jgi:hypothetical protein
VNLSEIPVFTNYIVLEGASVMPFESGQPRGETPETIQTVYQVPPNGGSGIIANQFNEADQLFFDQIVEAAIADERLKQAAVVNPSDKFELVFKNLLEVLFVERMDQNEDIFVRFMNDPVFQKLVTAWLSSEAYKKLRQ